MENSQDYVITGQLTEQDAIQLSRYLTVSRSWPLLLIWGMVFLTFLVAGIGAIVEADSRILSSLPGFLVIVVLFYLLVVWAPKRGAQQFLKSSGAENGATTYRFDSSGIQSKTSLVENHAAWGIVQNCVETASTFQIYTSKVSLYLIPKRLFPDEPTMQRWKAFVEEQIAPKKFPKPGWLARRF